MAIVLLLSLNIAQFLNCFLLGLLYSGLTSQFRMGQRSAAAQRFELNCPE